MENNIVLKDRIFPPFKLWGNVYFVGYEPASTHIVDTGEGLIMLDSGYQHSLYLVLHNMHVLGLNPNDIKYIIHTHGHIDHFGATKALVELTGAKTVIGELDKDYATGKRDLSYAKELGMEYNEVFEPDILLRDGDKLRLGNTVITAVHTPGHTEGCMSYFFDVTDGEKCLRAGLLGGVGLNTLCKEFLSKYNLPYGLQDKFLAAMDRLKDEKVDIYLGNHMSQNDSVGKYRRLIQGEKDAFVNPNEWSAYTQKAKQDLLNLMEKGE